MITNEQFYDFLVASVANKREVEFSRSNRYDELNFIRKVLKNPQDYDWSKGFHLYERRIREHLDSYNVDHIIDYIDGKDYVFPPWPRFDYTPYGIRRKNMDLWIMRDRKAREKREKDQVKEDLFHMPSWDDEWNGNVAQGRMEYIERKEKQLERKAKILEEREKRLASRTQRSLELEKRERNKKRKELAFAKGNEAQGLLDIFNTPTKINEAIDGVTETVNHAGGLVHSMTMVTDGIYRFISKMEKFLNPSLFDLMLWISNIMENGQTLSNSIGLCKHLSILMNVGIDRVFTLVKYIMDYRIETKPVVFEPAMDTEYFNDMTRKSDGDALRDLFGEEPITEPPVNEAQSALAWLSFPPLVYLLSQFVCITDMITTGKLITMTTIKEHFALIGRASQGFRAVREFVEFVISYVVDRYYRFRYGKTKKEIDDIVNYPGLANDLALAEVLTSADPKEIETNKKVCEEIIKLDARLMKSRTASIIAEDRTKAQLITAVQQKLTPFVTIARNAPINNLITRKTPLTIYLYGKSGTGKTQFQENLKIALFDRMKKNEDPNLQLQHCAYNRRVDNEFWDGYFNQPIVIYDDFMQIVDSPQAPNPEIAEVISIVNSSPLQLHMSEIRDKKSTYFNSRVVIFSSNTENPQPLSITTPAALYRRMHLCAEVSVRQECGTLCDEGYYKPDKDKIAAYEAQNGIVSGAFKTCQYQFKLYRMTTEGVVVTKAGLSYDRFMEIINENYDEKDAEETSLFEDMCARNGIDPKETDQSTLLDRITELKQEMTSEEILASLEKIEYIGAKEKVKETFTGPLAYLNDKITQVRETVKKMDLRTAFKGYYTQFSDFLSNHIAAFVFKVKNKVTSVAEQFMEYTTAMFGCVYHKACDFSKSAVDGALKYGKDVMDILIMIGTAVVSYFIAKKTFSVLTGEKTKEKCDYVAHGGKTTYACGKCNFCDMRSFTGCSSCDANRVQILVSSSLLDLDAPQLARLLETCTPCVCGNQAESRELSTRKLHLRNTAESREINTRKTLVRNVAQGNPGASESKVYTSNVLDKLRRRDLVSYEMVTSTVEKNARSLIIETNEGRTLDSNIVFVTGRIGITTNHMFALDFASIQLRHVNPNCPPMKFMKEQLKIVQCQDAAGNPVDLAMVELPKCVAAFPDITNKFLCANNFQFLNKEATAIIRSSLVLNPTKNFVVVKENKSSDFNFVDSTLEYTSLKGEIVTVNSYISTNIWNGSGLCGSLVALEGKTFNSKLVGLHVAGNPQLGYSFIYPVSQQFLKHNLKNFGIMSKIDGRLPYAQAGASTVIPGDIEHIGEMKKVPSAPSKSQLNPSLIHNRVMETTTKPAHLRPKEVDGVLIDPKIKGISKVTKEQVWLDDEYVKVIKDDLKKVIFKDSDIRRVLNMQEGVEGIEGEQFIAPINRTTSPGYPFNLENPAKGKQHWLGSDEEYIIDDEVKEDVQTLIESCKQAKRGDVIFVATLKDERRPKAKVDAMKTRVFEAAPMHYVIAFRMYFMAFANMIMTNRIDNEIAVGTNVYSMDWHRIAQKLKSKGELVFAGDFGNYDGSMSYQILQIILDLINEWYDDGPENALIRAVLWEDICATNVLVNNSLYRQTHSQPSGNPFTVIINSIANSFVMRYAYLVTKVNAYKTGLTPHFKYDFTKEVSMISYGDDNVVNVHPDIANVYNQVTVSEALATINFEYTDEAKTGELIEFRKLSEVEFLKRSFTRDQKGYYRAPLRLDVVLDMANWVRGNLIKTSTCENVETSLRELFYHGEDVYERYANIYERIDDELDIGINIPCYSHMWIEDTLNFGG
jgi:hypothetical protein